MHKRKTPRDISSLVRAEPLMALEDEGYMRLPCNVDVRSQASRAKAVTAQEGQPVVSLDGVSALTLRNPKSQEEEDKMVSSFLAGLRKLLSTKDNWTFLQPLTLSMDYCAKCQTCSDACPIYVGSGKLEIYRPTYRSEVVRRIKRKYLDSWGKPLSWLTGSDIELNWTTIARLAELAYRCTLCRRCAQVCPMGIDNALMARELRKLFSQELGIAPTELHNQGTVKQLEVGSSTGMTPRAFMDYIDTMEDEIEERTGRRIKIPVDKEGADILLVHNAGEFVAWPENPEAFAVIFEAAGVSWTLSSKLLGYDGVNYGTWYDDVQFAKIAVRQAQVAKDLKVNRMVVGECGHAHKALIVVADRLLGGELDIPRESCLPLLESIVISGKLQLDPAKNNFPVTLHDPCNIVRMIGIVEPQRRILRKICPQFREMTPNGVNNYCCGGGSGFAILRSQSFVEWRSAVAGRMKTKQIIDTFVDAGGSETRKYVCAPCSNCKSQLRGLLNYYDLAEKNNVGFTGLAELIANAMPGSSKTPSPWLGGQQLPSLTKV